MHSPASATLPPDVSRTNAAAISSKTRGLVPLALALAALWFVCARHLSQEWRFNEQYSYGWFVPFFCAYLFWLRWEDRPTRLEGRPLCRPRLGGQDSAGTGQRPSLQVSSAIGLILVSTLILLPARLFEVANPDWRPLGWMHAFAIVVITLSIVYLLGGGNWLRHFAFPICFILTAVPWLSAVEQPIVQGLMRLVAAMAAETISLLGIPAQVNGNVIQLAHGSVGVSEACSGVRSLQTSLMIGLLFGELRRLGAKGRCVLVLAALAIAFIANFCRALLLVSLAAEGSPSVMEKWHDLAGYAIVVIVFVGTMWTATKVEGRKEKLENRKLKVGTSEQKNVSSTTRLSTFSAPRFLLPTSYLLLSLFYFLLFFTVAIEVGVEWWYRSHERAMNPAPRWSVGWPNTAPGFRELPIDEGVRATLRFDQGREATWALAQDPPSRCFLFFFRWNPGGSSVVRARAHRPDICLPSAGWQQQSDSVRSYQVGNLALPFREIQFAHHNKQLSAHTYFCLQEDRRTNETRPDLTLPPGVQPDWSFPARWRAVRDGVRNMGQQVLEIIILTPSQANDADADAKFSEILREVVRD